jgi:hypothetical protein
MCGVYQIISAPHVYQFFSSLTNLLLVDAHTSGDIHYICACGDHIESAVMDTCDFNTTLMLSMLGADQMSRRKPTDICQK